MSVGGPAFQPDHAVRRGAAGCRWRPARLRRCSTGLPAGRSSRVSWVSARCAGLRARAGWPGRRCGRARPRRCRGVRWRSVPGSSARSSGRMWPSSSASSSRSRCWTVQRAHRCWSQMTPGLRRSRGRCARIRARVGCIRRSRGASRVPPRTGRTWPQPVQRAQRCWQASAPRSAGRRGDGAGCVAPADRAGQRLATAGSSHSVARPVRTLTGRRRPQPTQISWLTGSLIRQYGHSGRPCSSRVAGSRTAPQRAQGCARVLAVQLRHNHFPPIGRCRWITRPQRGQAGRMIV